jgi:type IV secretion system protein VirD4
MKLHASTKAVILCAGLLVLLVALSLSTQRVAADLRYHPALGTPLLELAGARWYAPWAWLQWGVRFRDLTPSPFTPAAQLSGVTAAVVALVLAIVFQPRPKPSTAHGSARWAENRELRQVKVLENRGIVLGQTIDARIDTRRAAARTLSEGDLLTHDGPEHAMIFAPTGSGKGVSNVLPTLYSWRGSAVVFDIKGELWGKSAGWRRQFSHCLYFDPTSRQTVRINPLLEIRRGDREVADVQNICDILVDPTGAKEERSHWDKTAHSFLTGLILHVLYAEQRKTLPRVAEILSDPERSLVETLEMMMDTRHLGDRPHPVVAEKAREMLNKEDREQSSVASTAASLVSLYCDPIISAATAESDFRLADLMHAQHPTTLYLSVPAGHLSRVRPLIRLLLNQMGRSLTEAVVPYNHRLLMLLDEFPALGRLEFFESALAYLRGYGIKCMMVVQSLNQLAKHYGERNSILDNCHVRVAFASNDDLTNRRISDLLGQATHLKTQKSFRGGLLSRSRSDNEQEHPRPLLTPGEVGQLPQDEALLFVGGAPPYRMKKVFYYSDERFRGCEQLPPPDGPAAQSRELPPPRPHDWLNVSAARPTPRPRRRPAAAAEPLAPAAAAATVAPPRLSSEAAADMLAAFDGAFAPIADDSSPAATDETTDHEGPPA